MQEEIALPRRTFIALAGPVTAGALLTSTMPLLIAQAKSSRKATKKSQRNEDLVREHGILKGMLLACHEIIRPIPANQDFSPQTVIDDDAMGEAAQDHRA